MDISVLKGEHWWGGIIHDGRIMPIAEDDFYSADLAVSSKGNQSVPLYLSSKGRYIWCEQPFKITFSTGKIKIDREDVQICEAGNCLKDAYIAAMKEHFPFSGDVPLKDFFDRPQYNTWVELTYDQNQESILGYAHSVIENGYKPGIIMIDDTWQLDYGMWQFDSSRFPEPEKMMDELHRLGFKVMLWVVPFISPDSPAFREADQNPDRLLRDDSGEPIILRWWNGYSAMLDMTKAGDREWMRAQLDFLQKKYNADGFKFDGGNIDGLVSAVQSDEKRIAVSRAWHLFGAQNYPYHELKDTFKCSGMPFVQRLRDKYHSWGEEGLADLIPDALNLSVTGHPFICPDMIGGGEWTCFKEGAVFDEELVVRYAQCSALFPMMQFSVAPWRILCEQNRGYVYKAQRLHSELGEEIYNIAVTSARQGEPMMRPLDYMYPFCGYEKITDQFMLGELLMVAPVTEKGAQGRYVHFPSGRWQDENRNIIEGPVKKWVNAPLSVLPWYRKIV